MGTVVLYSNCTVQAVVLLLLGVAQAADTGFTLVITLSAYQFRAL